LLGRDGGEGGTARLIARAALRSGDDAAAAAAAVEIASRRV